MLLPTSFGVRLPWPVAVKLPLELALTVETSVASATLLALLSSERR